MVSRWKRWCCVVLLYVSVFLGIVVIVNYCVDQLWCFDHPISCGRYQTGFEERQQKTNWLTFHYSDFDTIVIGDSRLTYLDPFYLPGKAFNYSASSLKAWEYPEYLEYFAERNKFPVNRVILGFSFFQTNRSFQDGHERPSWYIENAKSPGYRYRSLVDMSLFVYSLKAIKRDFTGDIQDQYLRVQNGKFFREMVLPVGEKQYLMNVESQVAIYRDVLYGGNYSYSDNREIYREIKKIFPKARFAVFVTPVSSHLLKVLAEEGRMDQYENWISGLVEEFGHVWNFMYFNEVTLDESHYKDAHHFSPEIACVIAKRILGETLDKYPDFGLKITEENLSDTLFFLRENFKKNL